jgi:hypothetical protein
MDGVGGVGGLKTGPDVPGPPGGTEVTAGVFDPIGAGAVPGAAGGIPGCGVGADPVSDEPGAAVCGTPVLEGSADCGTPSLPPHGTDTPECAVAPLISVTDAVVIWAGSEVVCDTVTVPGDSFGSEWPGTSGTCRSAHRGCATSWVPGTTAAAGSSSRGASCSPPVEVETVVAPTGGRPNG